MAIWQFALHAVPNMPPADVTPMQLTEAEVEIAWESFPVDAASLAARLSAFLPERKAWSEHLRAWGDEDSDDVQVWMQADTVQSIQFRVDVRCVSHAFLNGLCELASEFGWHLVDDAGVIVPSRPGRILKTILRSPAQRFVADPEHFLKQIAAENGEEG